MVEGEDSPICLFDSGLGGLTVLREVVRQLPEENVVYFGDTARVPYGSKSAETVVRFSLQSVKFLSRFDPKLLVVACNTASAVSIPTLEEKFPFPVVGAIKPGCRAAVASSRKKRIGVVGTEATIRSRAYEHQMRRLDPSISVFSKPCPLFVPLVEEGWVEGKVAQLIAKEYLRELKLKDLDTLVLGCTHYPLLKGLLKEEMGPCVALIDSAEEMARRVSEILEEKGMVRKAKTPPWRRYYVSDLPTKFAQLGRLFLGEPFTVERVDIEEY